MFFDYELPPDLIAQSPAAERDAARLLVVDRSGDQLVHHHVRDLPELLRPGDRLVFNDTKVIPARLVGQRIRTGGQWECLYLRTNEAGDWECLAKTRGYPAIGESFASDTGLTLSLVGRTPDRHWQLRPDRPGSADELLSRFGQIPLPPYIRKGREGEGDRDRYQTVYADRPGSVAAPTAGLHFTPALLERLAQVGVTASRVTLHVGLGTFASVEVDDPLTHAIHAEWCEVNPATVAEIQQTRKQGGRVIAVGTTTVRTLESAARDGELRPFRGETDLYVHPPFTFRAIDGMMTNFHLPRTTLLLMVQALAGSDRLREAYAEAIRKRYRFYSYGDAMLIV